MTKRILISACVGLSLAACSHSGSKSPTTLTAAQKAASPAAAPAAASTTPATSSSSQAGTAVGPNGFCTPQVMVDYKMLENASMKSAQDVSGMLNQVMTNNADPTAAKGQLKVDINAFLGQAKAFKTKYGDFSCNMQGPGGVRVISSSDVDQSVTQLSGTLAQL